MLVATPSGKARAHLHQLAVLPLMRVWENPANADNSGQRVTSTSTNRMPSTSRGQ
uniref:Orf protein n=1 Tax=Haliotis rubra TaxID=36100 RepID=Q25143_9VEST|nr:orf [Haliotis rubra]